MTVLNSKVEEIIREIKTDHSLDGVKFVKAYNGRIKEAPLGEILVTVGTGVETVGTFAGGYLGNGSKGERVNSKIKMNVYCPYLNGGDGITHTVNTLIDKISSVDRENLVSDISVSEIKFSKEYDAVYRTVSFNLDYCRNKEE